MRALLLIYFLVLTDIALAQDAKLIAEAKREAKLVIYGSMEQDIFQGVKQSFEKKTGISVAYWRASGGAVLERVITERKASKPAFDVVVNNAGPMEIMLKDGAFSPYNSPLTQNFPANFVHPQLGPSYRTGVVGIIYNRSIIAPEKAPKTLEDLLRPEYKGKLAFPDPTRGAVSLMWPASLYKLMTKDRADDYLRRLAATKPIIVEGVLVEREAVIGAAVTLTASTPIVDVSGSEPKEYRGRVPSRSVVIPGMRPKRFPAGEFMVPVALIIGQRKESTDQKTSLNDALRDFAVPV